MEKTLAEMIVKIIKESGRVEIEVFMNEINVIRISNIQKVRYDSEKFTLMDGAYNLIATLRNVDDISKIEEFGLNGIEVHIET